MKQKILRFFGLTHDCKFKEQDVRFEAIQGSKLYEVEDTGFKAKCIQCNKTIDDYDR